MFEYQLKETSRSKHLKFYLCFIMKYNLGLLDYWRTLTLKTNSSLKKVIKILKTGIELIQSKQQKYINHANIFIFTFDKM